jgi:hypothetical protein
MKRSVTVAALSLAIIGPAYCADIEASTGVVCNTQQQVARFVVLNDADPLTAIRLVNAEANDSSACMVASLTFVRGVSPVTVRKNAAAFQIVQILVVGIVTDDGVRAVVPTSYFSLFRIEERMARSIGRDSPSQFAS